MPKAYADELTTAPSVEPVSVAEARRACDLDDKHWDDDLTAWIIEGRKRVEHDARVALINQTRTLHLHRFPRSDKLELPAVYPLSSVTSVYYLDTAGSSTLLATSVYSVDTARKPGCLWLKNGQSWPDTYAQANAVTITYVAGFGATAASVPEAAKSAIKMYVRHRFYSPDLQASGNIPRETLLAFESLTAQLNPSVYP